MLTRPMLQTRRAHPIARAVVAVWLCGIAVPAAGQQTRDEQRAAEQANKATDLHPYVPTSGERRIEQISQMLNNRPDFYPFIGSVYRGGWMALGPGYRHQFASSARIDTHAAWSLKNYRFAGGTWMLPQMADGRLKVALRGEWVDAPKVAFYGVGAASPDNAKTSFLYRTTTIGGWAQVEPARFVAIGGGIDYFDVDTGAGKSGASIERLFTPVDTPGLGARPTYARSHLFAEFDSRPSPGYATSGGRYRLDWADYRARQNAPYSFRRLDAEVDQLVPLLRANWVIALRALGSFTDTSGANAVPYFLMPDLGGSSELRGYPSWRFRDRNRMLLTGEYRWMASQFIDMVLFVDAGKVAARTRDLDLSGLKRAYGIGARLHTPAATFVRFEVARTSDKDTGLIVSFGPVF